MELIEPREFVRLSFVDWVRDFPACVNVINRGTIFVIHGNEALVEAYHKEIQPRYDAGRKNYFGSNPTSLNRNQTLQSGRVLFSQV